MSAYGVKKKSLSIEDFVGLLKIEGFGGKFKQAEQVVAPSEMVVPKKERKNMPRPSFKLKEAMAKSVVRDSMSPTPDGAMKSDKKINGNACFDQDAVAKALQNYITSCDADPAIRTVLVAHHPVVEGNVVTLLVDNELLVNVMQEVHARLSAFLMEYLDNGNLVLKIELYDIDSGSQKDKKRLFTAQDKFEHFVALNPVVAELKNVFGLVLE